MQLSLTVLLDCRPRFRVLCVVAILPVEMDQVSPVPQHGREGSVKSINVDIVSVSSQSDGTKGIFHIYSTINMPD